MAKIALITGAYRGLGFECAKLLAAKKYDIVLTARKKSEMENAVQEIKKTGGSAQGILMDVTDEASIRSAAAAFSKISDHLDLLINNAAIFPDKNPSPLELSGEVFLQTLKTNTLGPIWVIQSFYPFLKKSTEARVINVSSGLGSLEEMESYAPAYSISKTALNAVTQQFAMHFEKDGISVNSVCPGWCRTQMGGKEAPRSPEEGAKSILWLTLEAPQKLTGGFYRDGQKISW